MGEEKEEAERMAGVGWEGEGRQWKGEKGRIIGCSIGPILSLF